MSPAPNSTQANMLSWRVILPFVLTGTIWGSTWFIITGPVSYTHLTLPTIYSV